MIWPKTLHEVKEDIKAWRRGERRVKPGSRGRVYKRLSDINDMSSIGEGNVELVPNRVWIDKEQKWYSIEEYHKKFGGT